MNRFQLYNEKNQKVLPDKLIIPWRIDIHCPISDGCGLRIEYDGEESSNMLPSVSFYALHVTDGTGCNHRLVEVGGKEKVDVHTTEEENSGFCAEYIAQTDNLKILEETFLELARLCQNTAKHTGEENEPPNLNR